MTPTQKAIVVPKLLAGTFATNCEAFPRTIFSLKNTNHRLKYSANLQWEQSDALKIVPKDATSLASIYDDVFTHYCLYEIVNQLETGPPIFGDDAEDSVDKRSTLCVKQTQYLWMGFGGGVRLVSWPSRFCKIRDVE